MVKIFDCVDPWPTKVNFVDSNNVVLGYDMEQDCCEVAEWKMKPSRQEWQLTSYVFDTEYYDSGGKDETYWVKFRLVSSDENKPDVYITLKNTHNGFYAHGFKFAGPSGTIRSGDL